jgi:hypothetical protein
VTPEEALRQFEQTTGLRVFAVLERDGTAWWAKTAAGTPVFECTIGDRVLHIDELASEPTPCPNSTPHRAHRWVQLPGRWRECQGVTPVGGAR